MRRFVGAPRRCLCCCPHDVSAVCKALCGVKQSRVTCDQAGQVFRWVLAGGMSQKYGDLVWAPHTEASCNQLSDHSVDSHVFARGLSEFLEIQVDN